MQIITNFIEVTVLQSLQDDGAVQRGAQGPEDLCVSAGRTRRHRMWRSARLAKKLRIMPLKLDDRARRILHYLFCLRRAFSAATTVHLAFDASRVGGKNRLLGFITRPDGLGAWLPPQVPSTISQNRICSGGVLAWKKI